MGVTLHGTTRNKQLTVLLHDLGLSISYTDVLDLYSAWTHAELSEVKDTVQTALSGRQKNYKPVLSLKQFIQPWHTQ